MASFLFIMHNLKDSPHRILTLNLHNGIIHTKQIGFMTDDCTMNQMQ